MSLKIFDITSPELPKTIPLPGGLNPMDKIKLSVNLQKDSCLEITLKASDDETKDSRVPLSLSLTLDRVISKSGHAGKWENVELRKPFPMDPGNFIFTINVDQNAYRMEVDGQPYLTFTHVFPSLASTFLDINVPQGVALVSSVSFRKEIKWINSRIGLPIPDTAFVCGMDEKHNEIYLGRGFKNNSMLVVNVNPALMRATVGMNGGEWPIYDYELLQDNSFMGWKKFGSNKKVPENAVEGGFNENGEKLYIGRVVNERALIPGSFDKTSGILSVPFKGKELKFSSGFEILTVLSPKEVNNNRKAELFNFQLQSLDTYGVVPNYEVFECKICFTECPEKEGVILRDCLHMFCKECLASHVQYSETPDIKCPYQDDVYSCVMDLQDREIRALVTPEIYHKHLEKSLRQAEGQMENTFHCMTVNCIGWCVLEDVEMFNCPVCQAHNCLKCKVIHNGFTCEQYQDRLLKLDNEEKSKQSKSFLEEMVRLKQAMNCPCGAIITKIAGCDGMTCFICKRALCWATKGPRWGPRGNGDTSGGCRCGVGGRRCAPNCGNCH